MSLHFCIAIHSPIVIVLRLVFNNQTNNSIFQKYRRTGYGKSGSVWLHWRYRQLRDPSIRFAYSFSTFRRILGGSTQSFFRNSKSPIYSKMWSRMSTSDPSPFVSTSAEGNVLQYVDCCGCTFCLTSYRCIDAGIERVQEGGYAFLSESSFIEYVTARYCDLYQVGGLIDSKGLTFFLNARRVVSIFVYIQRLRISCPTRFAHSRIT